MKKSTAIQHLRTFMLALQRYRSMAREELGSTLEDKAARMSMDRVLANLHPWIFGNKCPLEALDKLLARVGKTGELAPGDYYNMMTVLYRFTPEILVAATFLEHGLEGNMWLPKEQPSPMLMVEGWTKE